MGYLPEEMSNHLRIYKDAIAEKVSLNHNMTNNQSTNTFSSNSSITGLIDTPKIIRIHPSTNSNLNSKIAHNCSTFNKSISYRGSGFKKKSLQSSILTNSLYLTQPDPILDRKVCAKEQCTPLRNSILMDPSSMLDSDLDNGQCDNPIWRRSGLSRRRSYFDYSFPSELNPLTDDVEAEEEEEVQIEPKTVDKNDTECTNPFVVSISTPTSHHHHHQDTNQNLILSTETHIQLNRSSHLQMRKLSHQNLNPHNLQSTPNLFQKHRPSLSSSSSLLLNNGMQFRRRSFKKL